MVTIRAKLIGSGRRAILVVNQADRGVWLPLRLVVFDQDAARLGQEIEVQVPEWLAKREGLA